MVLMTSVCTTTASALWSAVRNSSGRSGKVRKNVCITTTYRTVGRLPGQFPYRPLGTLLLSYYSSHISPEPPISEGRSLNFGNPSLIDQRFSA